MNDTANSFSENDQIVSTDSLDLSTPAVYSSTKPMESMDDNGLTDTESSNSSLKFWFKVVEWHPFMRFFVRVANLMYASEREEQRPRLLRRECPRLFWLLLSLDIVVLAGLTVACLAAVALAVWKLFG